MRAKGVHILAGVDCRRLAGARVAEARRHDGNQQILQCVTLINDAHRLAIQADHRNTLQTSPLHRRPDIVQGVGRTAGCRTACDNRIDVREGAITAAAAHLSDEIGLDHPPAITPRLSQAGNPTSNPRENRSPWRLSTL